MRYDPRITPPSVDPTIREGFRSFTDIVLRWDVRCSVGAIVFVGVIATALLAGCASTTGSVQGVVIHDPSSGYDTGLGVSADAVTRGTFALATRATVSNATKRDADSGYTYSGSAGLRLGQRYFAEAGEIWYGYESQFADGSEWRKDRNTWYGSAGMTLPRWQGILRYYPSPGDDYDVEEFALESRHYFGRWLVTLEPSVYGITIAGGRRTETSFRGGFGVRW
jgi:hypothetical protein